VRSPGEGSSAKKDLNAGDLVAILTVTVTVTRRLDLTVEQWARLEPLSRTRPPCQNKQAMNSSWLVTPVLR